MFIFTISACCCLQMSVECSKLKSELADALEVNDELRSELSSNVGKMESLEQEVHVLQANVSLFYIETH